MSNKMVVYQTDAGAEVKLSPSIIRNYLVQGRGNVTDQEVMMFLMLCKQQRLDPFLRDAYLIKYGSDKPATLVTGKEVFTKRAERHPNFRGMVAGVIVRPERGELIYRPGSLVLDGEDLVGGWAKVWKAGRDVPYENSVTFAEYVGKKKDGTPNSQWAHMPATMIRKVALVQTLRETFPETFSGLYDQSEMSHVDGEELDEAPITRDVTPSEDKDNGPDEDKNNKPAVEPVTDSESEEVPWDEAKIGEPVTIGPGNAEKAVGKSPAEDGEVIDNAKSKADMLDGIGRTADKAEATFPEQAPAVDNDMELF